MPLMARMNLPELRSKTRTWWAVSAVRNSRWPCRSTPRWSKRPLTPAGMLYFATNLTGSAERAAGASAAMATNAAIDPFMVPPGLAWAGSASAGNRKHDTPERDARYEAEQMLMLISGGGLDRMESDGSDSRQKLRSSRTMRSGARTTKFRL